MFLIILHLSFYKLLTLKIKNLIIVLMSQVPDKFPGRDYEVYNLYGKTIPLGIIIFKKILSSLPFRLWRV